MPAKTHKKPCRTRKNKTSKKVSKRLLEIWKDPDSVWGKNKPLELFWGNLANGKNVVVIYKNGKHKYVDMPPIKSQKVNAVYDEFDQDPDIEAVLSSSLSQDAYEVYLYPKAKSKTPEEVIRNYKKYFKPINPSKQQTEGHPSMEKVRVPL